MQLSILMPTHRDDWRARARLLQACSWASADVEVVIRDNSGSAAKREFLEMVRRSNIENCKILFVEPCPAMANFTQCLAAASGNFVFFVSDDDGAFDRAVAVLAHVSRALVGQPSVVGMVGFYAVERRDQSSIATYQPLDSDDAAARLSTYLSFQGPNLLVYAAIRRATALRCFEFINGMPLQLPFHDQIISLMYLLAGKFANIDRLMYLYDYGGWEDENSSWSMDLNYYRAAGMDPALSKLQWLICAFEGGKIIASEKFFTGAPTECKAVLDRWLEHMLRRFASDERKIPASELAAAADAIREKWKTATPDLSLDTLQGEVCDFIARTSPPAAEQYRKFWSAV